MTPRLVSVTEARERFREIYTFNLAGYDRAHARHGEKGRYVFGGLSDAAFKVIPFIENMKDGTWPF